MNRTSSAIAARGNGGSQSWRLVELSHVIEAEMITYQGLPGPHICDFFSREETAANLDDGSSFQIGRIDMVANTGTYLDSPFHRFADGADFTEVPLASLANLPATVVRSPAEQGLETNLAHLGHLDVRGKAVLIHTGWDGHWRSEQYSHSHPFLGADAAKWLVEAGAALVGIDSYNIDDTCTRARPVHTCLLAARIPICEHMTGLAALPDAGSLFTAAPPKIAGMGTFPVRAFGLVRSQQR